MQLAPPGNSHCSLRTLQAWPGRYGAFFLLLFPSCLAREKMVVVPMFDRVHKDWFNVCLCLWIVKTIVLPEPGHDPFGSTEFFHSPDLSMSSRDVLFLWDVSEEVRGRIFSSCYELVLPTAMQ